MANHKNTISISAAPGLRKPKKIIDQSVFKTNCAPNKTKAKRFWVRDQGKIVHCFHTKYRAMPMRINSVVHTGPKIQLGGDKVGLCNAAYQVGMVVAVNSEPINPAACGKASEMSSLLRLESFIK